MSGILLDAGRPIPATRISESRGGNNHKINTSEDRVAQRGRA